MAQAEPKKRRIDGAAAANGTNGDTTNDDTTSTASLSAEVPIN